ncbi:hypothetical protein BCR44DRAFT_1294235 [Catenaria anguillulae PL171]|uniref:Uncharacterized protein n=1 Tax=Catenaria anguillulae PL171 TaxID=765915 RepID=A0A1Y2HXL6_9FUNG|nr:hypothetical protein BCR44DRAFT_1294235 [Catenaria anguillulae PL171]
MGADCCSGPSPRPARDPLALSDADAVAHLTAADRKKLDQVATYLANTKRSQVKLRQGIFNGSRVSYFRGKHAVTALQQPTAHALLLTPPPPQEDHVSDDEDGHPHNIHHHHKDSDAHCGHEPTVDEKIQYTLDTMVLLGMLVLVDKPQPKSKHLELTALQQFDPAEYLVLAHVPTSATHLLASVGSCSWCLPASCFPCGQSRSGKASCTFLCIARVDWRALCFGHHSLDCVPWVDGGWQTRMVVPKLVCRCRHFGEFCACVGVGGAGGGQGKGQVGLSIVIVVIVV